MKKVKLYKYLGTNGTITSKVFLEEIYSVKYYELTADQGKMLTNDSIHGYYTKIIPQSELEEWYEEDIENFVNQININYNLENEIINEEENEIIAE